MKRQLQSRLNLVFPNIEEKVVEKQFKQKKYHDESAKHRTIKVGELVFARNFVVNSKLKWIKGTVVNQTGPLSFKIELSDGRIIRRHVDHLRIRSSECRDTDTGDNIETSVTDKSTREPEITIPLFSTEQQDQGMPYPTNNDDSEPSKIADPITPRYPTRARKQLAYLKDYVHK
ncbi:unnamed protein product [Mytilus coruscus]|uniref:DUF5641 domain-containing protein n=1 Tax=Mytilus coruscus TaxID=42192 RepID=A0A6J8AFS0_MYTCO|nr:unnamed protein product [Mytilus coruscus]